jgi:hypothetical protein
MGSTDALMAIGLLVGFLGGVMAGIIVIVSAAYRREDRHYSLDGMAPDVACRATRRLTGAWVRGRGFRPLGWDEPGADPGGNARKQEARQ